MEYEGLLAHAKASKIFKQWHWYSYHFNLLANGYHQPFAYSILDACLDCDESIPGFAKQMTDALAEISGTEKHVPHYEQLLQLLAELLIIRQIVTWNWPMEVKFAWEPTAGKSKKNPEISIASDDWVIGVEVKAPSLRQHQEARAKNFTQVPSRALTKKEIETLPGASSGVTLPRDNPVKDFLISADSKFAEFRKADPKFFGLLVIVWDDFIYEPITALVHSNGGLLTSKSFARDKSGNALIFPNVDAVVVVRHLHQFQQAAGEKPLADGLESPLDYGEPGQFPFKVLIPNPHGRALPAEITECLQAVPQNGLMGAEYQTPEVVWWIGGDVLPDTPAPVDVKRKEKA